MWTAALDNDEIAGYLLYRNGVIAREVGATTLLASYGYAGTVTAPDDKQSHISHDEIGRPLVVTRPDGKTLEFAYEASGRRVLLVPRGKPAHTAEANPEAQTSHYTPPAIPNVASKRHAQLDDDSLLDVATFGSGAAAHEVRVARDAAGRPLTVTTPRGIFTTTYRPGGQLDSLSTPEGITTSFSFDGALGTGLTLAGPVSSEITFGYDTDLRLATETVNGVPVTFSYDADDLLTRAGALVLTRDPASGLLDGQTLGSLTWTFDRNDFGEVDRRTVRFGPLELFTTEILARDATGRILSRRELVNGEVHVHGYTY
ncbi:MAG: hypothetical protein L0206_05175, partial [Actinobacteria bacterium]|nr:hypothetical protein [Actinomycetota bacterium]